MKKISIAGLFSKLFRRKFVVLKNPVNMKYEKPLSVVQSQAVNLEDLSIKLKSYKTNLYEQVNEWYASNKVDGIVYLHEGSTIRFRAEGSWYYGAFLLINFDNYPSLEIDSARLIENQCRTFVREFLKSNVMEEVYKKWDKNDKDFKEVLEMSIQKRSEFNTRLEALIPVVIGDTLQSGSEWNGTIVFETAREILHGDKVVIVKSNTMTSSVELWKDNECIYKNIRMSNDLIESNAVNYISGNVKNFESYEL